jgi:hypothetical protein
MEASTPEWLSQIGTILQLLGALVGEASAALVRHLPLVLWVIWWLWGVNWKKAWPVLAQGGWVPVLLLMAVAALAWAQLEPRAYVLAGGWTIANGWWQLVGVSLLVAVALFCGFVQGYFNWTPQEIDLAPPAAAHHGTYGHVPGHGNDGHEHGHHGHEHSHS